MLVSSIAIHFSLFVFVVLIFIPIFIVSQIQQGLPNLTLFILVTLVSFSATYFFLSYRPHLYPHLHPLANLAGINSAAKKRSAQSIEQDFFSVILIFLNLHPCD